MLTFRQKLRSFLRGAGSVLDIMPAPRPSLLESYKLPTDSPWEAVGRDLGKAMGVERQTDGTWKPINSPPVPAKRRKGAK
jgi:hypothetical protein